MKAVKRNAVILTVMLFICAAVYLNWSYNKRVEEAAGLEAGDPSGEEKDGKEEANAQAGDAGAVSLGNTADEGDAGLYYTVAGSGEDQGGPAPAGDGESADAGKYDEYFAQVRLERSQARDEAASTLTAVSQAQGASPETVDGALQAMTRMAQYAVKEAELENLIRAKGFIDCVVYLTDDSVSVTVACEGGLDEAGAAKITDVIVSNTDMKADALRVTEIK